MKKVPLSCVLNAIQLWFCVVKGIWFPCMIQVFFALVNLHLLEQVPDLLLLRPWG